MGLWGTGGAQGLIFFSNMVMWHIKSTGMTSRTECKSHFYPRVILVTLVRGQKVKYHKHVIYMSISKTFIPNFVCVFSQIKDRKHIEQHFHSVARILPQGGTWGAGESKKNFIVGICDGAPSTARSSITFRPGQTQTQVCSYKRIGRGLERLYIQPIFWY